MIILFRTLHILTIVKFLVKDIENVETTSSQNIFISVGHYRGEKTGTHILFTVNLLRIYRNNPIKAKYNFIDVLFSLYNIFHMLFTSKQ